MRKETVPVAVTGQDGAHKRIQLAAVSTTAISTEQDGAVKRMQLAAVTTTPISTEQDGAQQRP